MLGCVIIASLARNVRVIKIINDMKLVFYIFLNFEILKNTIKAHPIIF